MKPLTFTIAALTLSLLVPVPGRALTLNAALLQARAANPALKGAAVRSEQAAAALELARSARLPSVDYRLGYTVLADAQAIVTRAGEQPTQEPEYAFATLGIEQILYDFGRNRSSAAAAAAGLAATEHGLAALEQEIFLQTVQGYYRVLEAEQLVAAADAEVASLGDHLRIVAALYEEGVVTRNDLLQAEVRLAAGNQQGLIARNRLDNAWLQFNLLRGAAALDRPALEGGGLAVPAGEFTPGARPDVRAISERVAAGDAEIDNRRTLFRPQIFARAEANYVENDHVREQTLYSATLGVRGNLFDGFGSSAALRRALAEREESRRLLEEKHLQAATEYRIAANDLAVAEARIAVLQRSVDQAEENLRINRERYREQIGTAGEVLDAQTLLTQMRVDYARAGYDRELAAARVLKAAGTLAPTGE